MNESELCQQCNRETLARLIYEDGLCPDCREDRSEGFVEGEEVV